MRKAVQQRTLETRARLTEVAQALVTEKGFEALRIDEVVQRAGVAKGTFFAHFNDKDELMDLLIGERINAQLDRMAAAAPPRNAEQLARRLMPLLELMASERYVFDVILRRSGAAAMDEIGAKGVNIEVWNAVVAPARMPAAHQARLSQELEKILSSREIRQKLFLQGWRVDDASAISPVPINGREMRWLAAFRP